MSRRICPKCGNTEWEFGDEEWCPKCGLWLKAYVPRNKRNPEEESKSLREFRDLWERYVFGQSLTIIEKVDIYIDRGPTFCHWFSWCLHIPILIGLPLLILGIPLIPFFLFVCDPLILLFRGLLALPNWGKEKSQTFL